MKKPGKIKLLGLASLSAVVLAGSIALAQTAATDQAGKQMDHKGWHGRGRHRGAQGQMHGMMFRGLNLTDDQKTRMKEVNEGFRQRTQSLRQELQAKRNELRAASEGSTFNEALATQKLQETAALQARLMGERFALRQEMLSLLTPEQKTQLEQKRADLKAKRAERRGARSR